MIFLFVLARHGLVLIDRRALFNLLPREINEKHLSLRIKTTQCMRGNQYQATAEPSTGVSDEIAYGPVFVVEVEISDVPNLAISGSQFFSVTLLNAVQHQKTFLILLQTILVSENQFKPRTRRQIRASFTATQKDNYSHFLEEVLAKRRNSGLGGAARLEDIILLAPTKLPARSHR